MCERRSEIDALEFRFDRLTRLGERGPGSADVQARLSVNRRTVRLAMKELSRRGCELVPLSPTRVHIPGDDGDVEHAFTRIADDETDCTSPRTLAGSRP